GLLKLLEHRLAQRHHAVIVAAEGSGQSYFPDEPQAVDASGNRKLGNIGAFLQERIKEHFAKIKTPVSVKYIDPSYIIRAAPANPPDQLFCARLAQDAVHAAMAGKSGMLVGYWHGKMTHVPLKALAGRTHRIDPRGELWFNVLESTGQPGTIG